MVTVIMREDEMVNLTDPGRHGGGMDAGGAGVRLTGPAGIARIHENGLTGGRDDQCAGAPFHVRPINVQRPGRPGGGVDRQHQCHQ